MSFCVDLSLTRPAVRGYRLLSRLVSKVHTRMQPVRLCARCSHVIRLASRRGSLIASELSSFRPVLAALVKRRTDDVQPSDLLCLNSRDGGSLCGGTGARAVRRPLHGAWAPARPRSELDGRGGFTMGLTQCACRMLVSITTQNVGKPSSIGTSLPHQQVAPWLASLNRAAIIR